MIEPAARRELLERAVVPTRLALVRRGEETVGYNPNLNVWHRLDEETAVVLRGLRAGRPRQELAAHLERRFGCPDGSSRLDAIVRWSVLRRLLHVDREPDVVTVDPPERALAAVYWICTQACNLRCTYCYQDAMVARPGELTTAEGRDLVDQAVEAGAETFIFTGGEPFSRRDLLELASYSKACGLRTNVVTNGHFITRRRLAAVAEIFDRVTVSLDHGRPEHHDRARGTGSWRRAAAAIDLLLEAGVTVDVNSVVGRAGLDEIDELLRFVRRRGVAEHRMVPQYPMGRGGERRADELSATELLALDDRLQQVGDDLAREGPGLGGHCCGPTKGARRSHCGAGLSEVSVDPEGWVYPCKLLQQGACRTANVRDRRLAEIVASDPVLAGIRRPFVETLHPCRTCIIRHQCGGGCRGIHASFSGSWTAAEPLFCAQLRRSFELDMFAGTGTVPARRPPRFVRSEGAGDEAPSAFIPIALVGRR